MPQPAMRPGNVNKHPGQIVLEASRVARPKDVIAAEKRKASAEKLAKATALENAQKKVAATEDAMAVEQMAQRAGPGHLVRPKPKPRPVTKAAPTANPNKMSVEAKTVSQSTDALKKKYPGLKLTFKDGSNSGKNRRLLESESSILTEEVEVGKWARSVASKSQQKPSAPPSARASVIASRDADVSEDENLPEDHDESVTVSRGGQGVMHIIETVDDATMGRKCTLSTTSLDDLEPEERRKMEEDQDADKHIPDEDEDVDMTDQQGDMEMSVSVMDTMMDGPKSKYIKTKNGRAQRTILNLKKEKPKNSHLPSAAHNLSFCSIFIPMVIHWVSNNNYPWTIPDEKLSDVLEDIFMVVCQRISEWRGNFGSTAITILMAFFASTDEYKTKEARKEYAEYQLEDSRFIIDSLDFGLPGYPTALALTTAAAERALILARDDLIVEDASDHRKHKIALTLNHSTNKMSNTGTAFSAGNWETDTLVYME
ncbi:uncharacterized protein F5147DRAFT_647830 [Suillus discolor]|uniref:Uncharacterized protein n=1 Tax=Suillus discolor TaxID=1912936 RepID=A0A9P7FIH8_9AGAM|nr:uncharacterized protein F5147DRAFT_647830 [Suillus discolor]KAG2118677.1 hypothetical protein F5147DRAFT_647830 [Suillus discolor]